MNLAIIRHIGADASDKHYAFSLPDAARIGKGTLLALETQHGDKIGEMVEQVVAEGSGLDYILRSLGTDEEHLRQVKGIFIGKTFEEIRAENRYEEGGAAYIRVCKERDELKANLFQAETERDMLKSKLSRILKCCGVGE